MRFKHLAKARSVCDKKVFCSIRPGMKIFRRGVEAVCLFLPFSPRDRLREKLFFTLSNPIFSFPPTEPLPPSAIYKPKAFLFYRSLLRCGGGRAVWVGDEEGEGAPTKSDILTVGEGGREGEGKAGECLPPPLAVGWGVRL